MVLKAFNFMHTLAYILNSKLQPQQQPLNTPASPSRTFRWHLGPTTMTILFRPCHGVSPPLLWNCLWLNNHSWWRLLPSLSHAPSSDHLRFQIRFSRSLVSRFHQENQDLASCVFHISPCSLCMRCCVGVCPVNQDLSSCVFHFSHQVRLCTWFCVCVCDFCVSVYISPDIVWYLCYCVQFLC